MRGGVHWYAAQAIPQIDADSAVRLRAEAFGLSAIGSGPQADGELVAKKATFSLRSFGEVGMAKSAIAEKGHLWMETIYVRTTNPQLQTNAFS